jgi:virginiamycin B lyase
MRSPSELARWPRTLARPLGAALVLVLAAGCAGAGTSVPSTSQPKGTAAMQQVTFTMHWNSASSSSSTARSPKYVPATALSVGVMVNFGVPQYLNFPQTSLVIAAPAGYDTFTIATYNAQNGQGLLLSTANISQNIVDGAANTVTAVLNGVIASIKLSLTNPNFPDGTSATLAISALARDADGSIILGTSDYANPITLVVSDTNGTLGLAGKVLSSPSSTASVTYNGGTLINGTLTASAGPNVTPQTIAVTGVPTVYECPVAGEPQYIAGAKDGTAWYTDNNNTVVHITTSCVLSPYTIPTGNANPQGITLGENGNMWFTEYNSSKVAEVTPSGSVSEFGTLFGSDSPQMLADRGDGTVWYAGYGGNHVGYVNEFNGVAGETTMPTGGSGPWDVAEAPNGYLYVSENLNDDMARLATLFQSPIPQTPVTSGSESESVVLGPDGNLWFTQFGLDHIGVVSPTSNTQIGYYATASSSSVPVDITVGLDGALWYTESGTDRIGRMLTTGVSAGEYHTLSSNTNVKGIATGSDGAIWFCESNTSKVGRIVY